MASFSDLRWLNVCDGQLKTSKSYELTSDSKTILLHIETEAGKEEV